MFAYSFGVFSNFIGGASCVAGIPLCGLFARVEKYMICPHCQKEMPHDHGAVYCPLCGKDLASKSGLGREPSPVKFNARLFFCALLLPSILTLISAAIMRSLFSGTVVNEGVSPMVGLAGGALGGVICGILLGRKTSTGLLERIFGSLIFSAVMIVVCVMLCWFGCNLGGYELRIG
jgi:hypothetical protein